MNAQTTVRADTSNTVSPLLFEGDADLGIPLQRSGGQYLIVGESVCDVLAVERYAVHLPALFGRDGELQATAFLNTQHDSAEIGLTDDHLHQFRGIYH